jgi:alpha-amylase/alpha-mannosidase (GH57 family)
MNASRYICIHGHFYQPPRENPWLERIEEQESAYPYHDWNERINKECYAPNTAARIIDPAGRILDIINNYENMSFNFGPSLLSWMQHHSPATYAAVIDADRRSQKRFSGHGSAIAQGYNHIILPLANSRDKYTQVYWGIRDFEFRFGRKPEGMWLPETAVDLETLDILAEQGIKFTILAPRQAARIRKIGDREWQDISGGRIDPRNPYRCNLPSGRQISLFFYDGPIAQDLAFGGLLADGATFAARLKGVFNHDNGTPQVVHVATDGESYGHHHRFGDMALAYCLYSIEQDPAVSVTIYAQMLDLVETVYEVEIFENSSWSCIHGVERWRSDCGCNSGMHGGWNQRWRGPLRAALDRVRDALIPLYEQVVSEYINDPWAARNDYISIVLDRSDESVAAFFSRHARRDLTEDERIRILHMLEMQRHAMLMYTSCGWFFDEVSGIETVQVMKYAARAMQLARDITGVDVEEKFLSMLVKAPSNIPELGTGAEAYIRFVKPSILDSSLVAVHYAILMMFDERPETFAPLSFSVCEQEVQRLSHDKAEAVLGKLRLCSKITNLVNEICFAVIDTGDYRIHCGVSESLSQDAFGRMKWETAEAFAQGNMELALRRIQEHFGNSLYGLRHMFAEERKRVLRRITQSALQQGEELYRNIFTEQYAVMELLRDSGVALPPLFARTIEFVLNTDIRNLLESETINFDKLRCRVEEIKKWMPLLDKRTLNFVVSNLINRLMAPLRGQPENLELLEYICAVFRLIRPLALNLDIWESQNLYFAVYEQYYPEFQKKAEHGDMVAGKWLSAFDALGPFLQIKLGE